MKDVVELLVNEASPSSCHACRGLLEAEEAEAEALPIERGGEREVLLLIVCAILLLAQSYPIAKAGQSDEMHSVQRGPLHLTPSP